MARGGADLVLPSGFKGCPRCDGGELGISLRCWQCAESFHTHPSDLSYVPIGHNVLLACAHCGADNAFARVPLPDFLVNANELTDQPAAIWG